MAANEKNAPSQNRALGFAASVLGLYQNHLHRFLVRRLRNDQDAKDLAQEVYLRLLRVDDAKQIQEPLAYLYRTAANVASEFLMRRQRERVHFDTELLEQRGEHPSELWPDELPDRLDTERAFQHALSQLPPLYQSIFLLRLRDGLSYADIGIQLEISAHTVKKYFFRSIGMIRTAKWDQ
jgi:RNA polymerase sigma factor (sigma-70 family)